MLSWNEYIEELLSMPTVLDNLSLQNNGNSIAVSPIVKASIQMLESMIETVWFSEHVLGGKMDKDKLNSGLKADAIIPFEIVDFTLTQYVVDAAEMGQNKVLYEMGHFNAEELGMRYMCTWIQDVVHHEVSVEFVQAGDFFQYRGRQERNF